MNYVNSETCFNALIGFHPLKIEQNHQVHIFSDGKLIQYYKKY